MAKRPTPDRDDQPTTITDIDSARRPARAAPRRAPRDRHLPGDDRPAPGRPREERQRPQRRRRRGRPDRPRHPAPGRAGGHRVPVRAVRASARWRRSPRSSSSRTAPSGRSSRARPACGCIGFVSNEPFLRARDRGARPTQPSTDVEVQALMRTVQAQIEQYVADRRPGAARGRRRRPQHHRARAAGRHGRVLPGHDHRAAPGAPRDDRRHRAAEARSALPRPPDRDPRAQGPDPVRGQVRDGQDPARVHPPRADQGDPARARRGRPAAGRDQRASRQGRGRRHARGDQGPGDQGSRPDEPDPVRLARGRRHPDLRRLARRAAVERRDRRPATTSRRPPRSSTRTTTASRRSRSGSSSTSRSAPSPTRSAARSSPSSARPASARRRSARASPGRWAASSSG